MIDSLSGQRVAFLVAQEGVEQVELTEPWKAVQEAGAKPELVAPEDGEVQGYNHLSKASTFRVDNSLNKASAQEYDALVLPGGVASPDQLRQNTKAVGFVREFIEAGKTVGAICHGPWTLVEAGVLQGRKITSWPSLKTDIRNAGGEWVDEEVVSDNGLISSRKPSDLSAFNERLVTEIASRRRKHGKRIYGEEEESREIAWRFVYAESVEELEQAGVIYRRKNLPEKIREELWSCYIQRLQEIHLNV